MAYNNTNLFSYDSGNQKSQISYTELTLTPWKKSYDKSDCIEAGGQASLISWHSYIGIPINFHEESGIVTF